MNREIIHSVVSNMITEVVSALTRIKLARAARRTAKRRGMLRRLRAKRRRSLPQLTRRAKQHVKTVLRNRVYKGSWQKLSYSQRANIDSRINKRKRDISSMVKRIMPSIVKGESTRLQRINSSYEPFTDNLEIIALSEARTPQRPKLDSDGKRKRKTQNRDNKRSQRQRDEVKVQAGDINGTVMVVKDRNGDISVIDKESYNSSKHSILVSSDKANTDNVSKYLNNKSFVNTKTSERIFGYIKGAGNGKSDSMGKTKEDKQAEETSQPIAPPKVVATKKASKKDTFPSSHGAIDMEAGIVYAANTMMGLSPEQIIQRGFLDKRDMDIVLANQHESFMPSCQRAAQQIIKMFGGTFVKHISRVKKETKLSQESINNGVVDTTPKVDLLIVNDKGEVVAGLSQKIGESQISSGGPSETITNLKWALFQVGDQLTSNVVDELEVFIKFFENDLTGNPRTKSGPVSLYGFGGQKEGEDAEVERREMLHEKATDMLNKILNNDKKLSALFVYALMSGAGKFVSGDPGIATHIFSACRDGTESKITPLSVEYAEKILDKVKFQMKFKSAAVETIDYRAMWEEFKDRKKLLGEKVKLEEDFRPYSFRSVVRVYLLESPTSYKKNLINLLVENQSEKKIKELVQEPQTHKDSVDYLESASKYIETDGFKLSQFFQNDVDFLVSQPILDWSEYAESPSTINNKIFVNGKEHNISVETPYNYEEDGSMLSPLGESRNYRKEYDNYHSTAKQRKNRSKRVLARRLMIKLGRAKKGDGKDIDHKDSNPQNNSVKNLRSRNRSENRADND